MAELLCELFAHSHLSILVSVISPVQAFPRASSQPRKHVSPSCLFRAQMGLQLRIILFLINYLERTVTCVSRELAEGSR